MPPHARQPGPAGALSSFEKSCAYCGARFRVTASHLPDEDRSEDYACPECGKTYETEASAEPRVQLLRARTDGKSDPYQETFF
jgi:DNA-directed RNA polymerase subunit RPC12/RpoP